MTSPWIAFEYTPPVFRVANCRSQMLFWQAAHARSDYGMSVRYKCHSTPSRAVRNTPISPTSSAVAMSRYAFSTSFGLPYSCSGNHSSKSSISTGASRSDAVLMSSCFVVGYETPCRCVSRSAARIPLRFLLIDPPLLLLSQRYEGRYNLASRAVPKCDVQSDKALTNDVRSNRQNSALSLAQKTWSGCAC